MKSLFRFLVILVASLGFLRAAQINEAVVAKIALMEDGTLFFDGKKIEVAKLDSLLAPIKEENGVVWYYEANSQSESTIAASVMKAVFAKELPIKIFSKADFSEYFGNDGKPHKQKTG